MGTERFQQIRYLYLAAGEQNYFELRAKTPTTTNKSLVEYASVPKVNINMFECKQININIFDQQIRDQRLIMDPSFNFPPPYKYDLGLIL